MADTATDILDAAERLFAANGYGATSIRSITREACLLYTSDAADDSKRG